MEAQGYYCYFNQNSRLCGLVIMNGRRIKHEGDWTCEMKMQNDNKWVNTTGISLEFKNDPAEFISNSISNFLTGFFKSMEEIANLVENFD